MRIQSSMPPGKPHSPRNDYSGGSSVEPPSSIRIDEPAVESVGDARNNLDSATMYEDSPARVLTVLDGMSLVVGLMIGSGIFSAPAAVCAHVASPSLGMFVWLLAGLLGWAGASSFIELGTTIPENGGIQEYLRQSYGEACGFLFAWVWILLIKPCSMAMIALIFAEYGYRIFLMEDHEPSIWLLKAIALITVSMVTFLNCLSTQIAARTSKIFLCIKFISLGLVIVAALLFKTGFLSNPSSSPPSAGSRLPRLSAKSIDVPSALADVADALFSALFASGGWDTIGFVAGELRDPLLALPRILQRSMFVVIPLTLLTNAAFYIVLSVSAMKNSNAVALSFGRRIFGRAGAWFFTCIVSLCCLGSLNATIFSLGRLTQAAGKRGYLPEIFRAGEARGTHSYMPIDLNDNNSSSNAHLSEDHLINDSVPRNAMLLNASIASIYILIGSFRSLITFKGMAEYLLYSAAVSTILVARFRAFRTESESSRSAYRTPLVYPICFCLSILIFILSSALRHVTQAISIVLLFAGCYVVSNIRSMSTRRLAPQPTPN